MMKGGRKDRGDELISASEISQYIYCPISWRLKRAGARAKSPGLSRGRKKHAEMGRELGLLRRKERAFGLFRIFEQLSIIAALLLLGWLLRSQL